MPQLYFILWFGIAGLLDWFSQLPSYIFLHMGKRLHEKQNNF